MALSSGLQKMKVLSWTSIPSLRKCRQSSKNGVKTPHLDKAAVPIHRAKVYDSLFAGQEVQVEVLTQEDLELVFHS